MCLAVKVFMFLSGRHVITTPFFLSFFLYYALIHSELGTCCHPLVLLLLTDFHRLSLVDLLVVLTSPILLTFDIARYQFM